MQAIRARHGAGPRAEASLNSARQVISEEIDMDVIQSIQAFNEGREPERLQIKYRKMRDNPFVFLRGTCHLFYERLPDHDIFRSAPLVWSCGDLHLENFGTFKGNDRQIYFDINDFEEAALAPASWDLVRMLSSIQLGCEGKDGARDDVPRLCKAFLDAYAAALATGKAQRVERNTATGLVKDLFDKVERRSRAELLDDRTELHNGKRRVRLGGDPDKLKALKAPDKERDPVERALEKFARASQDPKFYDVLHVARRVAGTGSLGLSRFVVVVEGKGSPDDNYLLDLKQSTRSALLPSLATPQPPAWETEAERIVQLQARMQAVSAALLHPILVGGDWHVLRELQPSEDAVSVRPGKQSFGQIEQLMVTMGQVVGWAHLRGAGRQGSAAADQLVAWGRAVPWKRELMDLSGTCAQQARQDAKVFAAGYDRGEFIAGTNAG